MLEHLLVIGNMKGGWLVERSEKYGGGVLCVKAIDADTRARLSG